MFISWVEMRNFNGFFFREEYKTNCGFWIYWIQQVVLTLHWSIAQSICSDVGLAEKNSLGLPECTASINNNNPVYQNTGDVTINLFSTGSSIKDLLIKRVGLLGFEIDLCTSQTICYSGIG